MVEYSGDTGGQVIPAVTYDGFFWRDPIAESGSPATEQAAA